ncbi:MAG: hypothetical protein ACI4UV_09245 [Victivallales bacterium]
MRFFCALLGKKGIELVKQLPRELVFLQFRTEKQIVFASGTRLSRARSSGIALALMDVYDLKITAKLFPRHKFFQSRQHVAVLCQIIQTIVYVK